MEKLHDHWIVEAKLTVAQLDCRLTDMGAARPHANHADVAGNEAHQNEDQGCRSCQRRDGQQESGHDIAMHVPRLTSPPATCRATCWRDPGSDSGSGGSFRP